MDVITPPEMPQGIIDAINSDSLAVFVGAGVSAIAGLPLWSQLAKDLICECQQKGFYSYKDKELILERIHDNKQLITIAYGKLKENGLENDFYRILRECLTLKSSLSDPGRRIFSWLKDTMPLVLTTNADTLLHEYFEPSRISEIVPDSIDEMPLKYGCLVHLHGVIDRENTLVFTTQQYLTKYQLDQYKEYLRAVFTTKTVLFIGYGMSEFELLDVLIQKSNSKIKHYFLAPYFSYEYPIATAMNEYYNQLGIEQIPYYIDEKGYSFLADILDAWVPKIKLKSDLMSRGLLRIRELVELDPKVPAVKEEALQLIRSNILIEKEFFDHLNTTQSQFCMDWFLGLETSECFDPKFRNNPPKLSNEGDGRTYYSSSSWYGLRRLLEFSQADPDNTNYKRILLNVVKSTIKDTLDNPPKAGNWATGAAIAKCIVLLSPEELGDELWEYVKLVSGSSFALNQDIFTAEFAHNIEIILTWPIKHILRMLKMFFDEKDKPGSESEFWFERITEKWLSSFVNLAPDSIVEMCISTVLTRYEQDAFKFWEVGAFSKYPDENGEKKNDFRDYNASLIVWLRTAIEALSHESAIILASCYMVSPCPILRRMAIFTMSYFYDSCGHLLFDSYDKNPFDDGELLSDLFDFIKINLPKFDNSQVDKLFDWISSSNFGIQDDSYSQAKAYRRAIFLSLFKDIRIEYHEEFIKFSGIARYDIFEKEAYNISKHMYTVANEHKYPDNRVISQLESVNINDWPTLLAEITTDITHSQFMEWAEAIETVIRKSPNLFFENTSAFLEIPNAFIPYTINVINGYDFSDQEVSSRTADFLLRLIEKYDINDPISNTLVDVFRLLKNHYLDDDHQYFYVMFVQILEKFSKKYLHNIDPWDQNEDPVLLTYNEPFPMSIRLLISFLAKIKSADIDNDLIIKCLDYFQDQLSKYELDWIFRCALATQINSLAYIDLNWVKKHLDTIFNNSNPLVTIPVSICYASLGQFSKELYSFFSETGYFSPILHLPNDLNKSFIGESKRNISSFSTYAFVNDLDDISYTNGLLNCVLRNIDSFMLMAGINYFETQFSQDTHDETIDKNTLQNKLEIFLIEARKHYNDFTHMQILTLIKCVRHIHQLSHQLWDVLLYFTENCPQYSMYEDWFDFIQNQIESSSDKVADLLIAIIQNPKFSYLQKDKRELLQQYLRKLHDSGENEKVRTIRNLLLNKGFTEFAEIL